MLPGANVPSHTDGHTIIAAIGEEGIGRIVLIVGDAYAHNPRRPFFGFLSVVRFSLQCYGISRDTWFAKSLQVLPVADTFFGE
jgi:hypothetical protein